jgi:hypothetical protein
MYRTPLTLNPELDEGSKGERVEAAILTRGRNREVAARGLT